MRKIDPENANLVVERISASLGQLARTVNTEIQDDGEFLLVRVEQDPYDDKAPGQIVKIASSILDELLEPRADFAWMVNVERRGVLVESEVGGRTPRST
jgi:predicted component of type VI protein secretion system